MLKHFNSLAISFSDIVSRLNEHDVVIDYYDYPIAKDKQYIAFIYRKGDMSPVMVRICRYSYIQAEFEKAADRPRGVYANNGTYTSDLGMILFGRIAESCKISPDETIYLIPSGVIHKINIAALTVCTEKDERLYEKYSKLIRLTHVRNLTSIADDNGFKEIQLYGGLEYDWEQGDKLGESRGVAQNHRQITVTPLLPWQYLPSSKIEVNDIADIWNANKNTKANVNTGKDGSTEHFYSMDGDAPSIIHLATHGFFETKQSVERLPALRGLHQPMDLTGIVMSYGNEGWILGNPDCHKGIIKATDICSMDLGKTKMVVLSTCHSAEGAIQADGVFGLQRAFKKAGAGCIIMSLWEVSDEAGSFFMRAFYQELLSARQDRYTAFRNAQKHTRNKFPEPLYWAGYIMID
jgi:CHAT domain-containing protein